MLVECLFMCIAITVGAKVLKRVCVCVCVCVCVYVWSQLKWSKHIWAFKKVMWGFSIFFPHMDLPGWVGNWCSCLPCRSRSSFSAAPLPAESSASDTLSSPWCGRAPPPAENSTNTVTIWALFGVVVPLLQLKTQHKKMMVPLAKLNTHCTNTATMQVLQKPGSFWSNHATPPPPPSFQNTTVKTQMVENPTWSSWLDEQKKERKKKMQDTDDTKQGTKFSLFVCRWWRLPSRSAGQHGNHRDKSVSWPPDGSSLPPWGCLAQNTWKREMNH